MLMLIFGYISINAQEVKEVYMRQNGDIIELLEKTSIYPETYKVIMEIDTKPQITELEQDTIVTDINSDMNTKESDDSKISIGDFLLFLVVFVIVVMFAGMCIAWILD